MTRQEQQDLASYIYDNLGLDRFAELTVKSIEISISDYFNDAHSEQCENKRNKEEWSLENLIDQDPNG